MWFTPNQRATCSNNKDSVTVVFDVVVFVVVNVIDVVVDIVVDVVGDMMGKCKTPNDMKSPNPFYSVINLLEKWQASYAKKHNGVRILVENKLPRTPSHIRTHIHRVFGVSLKRAIRFIYQPR